MPAISLGDLYLPPLHPPDGVRLRGGGGGGGSGDAIYSATRIETALPVRRVAAHYVDLLKQNGWTVDGDDLETRELVVVRFRTKTQSGAEVTGLLSVTALGTTGAMDLHLRAIRNVVLTPPAMNPSTLPLKP